MARVFSAVFVTILFQAAWGSAIYAVDECASASVGIVGGQNASIAENPSAVSLAFSTADGGLVHVCGGSIIDESFILTAASCVHEIRGLKLSVRFGSSYLNSGGAYGDVENVTIHEKYNEENMTNNIALLKLKTPILFGWLAKANLAAKDYNLIAGTQANFTGWGFTDADIQESFAEVLQESLFQIKPLKCCDNAITKVLDASFICAGSAVAKPLPGDGGSPLTQNGVLIGIESYAADAKHNKPYVFTNVASYLDWIESTKKKF